MSGTQGLKPPPGWYQDAPGASHVRWWSGEAWTEHVRMPQPPVVQPAPVDQYDRNTVIPDGFFAAAPQPVQVPVNEFGEPARKPTAELFREAAGYAPAVHEYRAVSAQDREEFIRSSRLPTSQTVSSWLLVIAPPALLVGIEYGYPRIPEDWLTSAVIVGSVMALLSLVACAAFDSAALARRGYHPPFIGFALLPPFYFALRAMRVGWRGLGQLLFSIVTVGAVVAYLVWPMLSDEVPWAPFI